MWTTLLGGLQAVASASAEEAAKVVQEGAQEAAGATPELHIPVGEGKLPTPQQLLEALDSMTGLSEEEKTQLKEDLLKNIHERATQAQAAVANGDFTSQTVMLLALLSIVALIFVFFVYKLFKLLSDRENKREEKKKNKQLKKKK